MERLGIEFLEYVPTKPQVFQRSSGTGVGDISIADSSSSMPTFHWIEFLVLADTQLQQIQTQQVAWIHVPHAEEHCAEEFTTTGTTATRGSSTKVNCLVAQFVLGRRHSDPANSDNSQNSGNNTMLFYGREANNYETALSHPQLRQPF